MSLTESPLKQQTAFIFVQMGVNSCHLIGVLFGRVITNELTRLVVSWIAVPRTFFLLKKSLGLHRSLQFLRKKEIDQFARDQYQRCFKLWTVSRRHLKMFHYAQRLQRFVGVRTTTDLCSKITEQLSKTSLKFCGKTFLDQRTDHPNTWESISRTCVHGDFMFRRNGRTVQCIWGDI